MSVGVEAKRTYLNIRDGKIVRKGPDGEKLFDYVEGRLAGIGTNTREFKGEQVKQWYFELRDEKGEDYVLSMSYHSGVAKSIINSLASARTLGLVKISVYQKGEFTKASVYNNGERLSWKVKELPEVKVLKVGDKEVKDDTERMAFIEGLAREITENISELDKLF